MATYQLLPEEEEESNNASGSILPPESRRNRLVSLDVFRGLTVALMIFVDYASSPLPFIAHSPWNGLQLADFVMPFFLFIVGVSVGLVNKNISNRILATCKATLRALKLYFLGIFLQGGYFHGVNSLTFGVDIQKIRWLGILQRIAIGYYVTILCEIWFSCKASRGERVGLFKSYYFHWFVAFSLSAIYLGLLYGLYVPDWQFKVPTPTPSVFSSNNGCEVLTVRCNVRGDLGPACNSAGMIDRYILGSEHLYTKPTYRNLEECTSSKKGRVSESSPWCLAPFDPEGILSSLMATVTCIIGLHFGHVLEHMQDHKERIFTWVLSSILFLAMALILTFLGIPVNKSLYTISYMCLTSATAGLVFCTIYLWVDVCGYQCVTIVLEWMGMNSLSIFVLVASNVAVIAVQGLYWIYPENNIIHWVISHIVRK